MASLKEYRDEQIHKLQQLRSKGVNPYPARSARDTQISAITNDYDAHQDSQVTVAGRVLSLRTHGKLSFIDIADQGSQIQLIVREESITANYANQELEANDINLLTRGDFIESRGIVGKSKRGEVSVLSESVRILSKVLRPLPDQLTDKETRLRRRYLDMAINTEVRDRVLRRGSFWQAVRQFHLDHGFNEVAIPILEHTTGGADASPFVTHMNALDEDFYLRISHELPLKRLIGAGIEKVFDIGHRFRNENYTDEHLPEHIAMEGYWAYADWMAGKEFLQEMILYIADTVYTSRQFHIRGFDINLDLEWGELDFSQIMRETYDINIFDVTLERLHELMNQHGVESGKDDNKIRCIDKLWKEIRKTIGNPVFLVNVPTFISPLAKQNPENPNTTERLQLILAGSELINGWSELNDAQEQLARFIDQQAMRNDGDDEAQMLDIDYVEMLEYGMPPTFGYGFSERLFWFFENVTAREGVPFPQLRREIDDTTKDIYPELYGGDGVLR